MIVHTPLLEHISQNCEDECDNDERLLLDKQFENELLKFCEKTNVEVQKISSNHVEKMEHVENNCEDACIDDEPDELFKDGRIIVVRKLVLRIISLELFLRKRNLI